MNNSYEAFTDKAAACEQLSKVAADKSIREKAAELAKEYRSRAEKAREFERESA